MNLCLLGAPGSGKGTQAKMLSEYYDIAHISTGDLFRRAISENTPLGIKIKKYMSTLVPDEIVIDLVMERISNDDCKRGFVLDGFPRTINQANLFLKHVKIDKVVYLDVDRDVVINRIKSRRTCSNCGAIYSTLTYDSNICSNCGSKLVIREEDKKIDERMDTYYKETYPLVEYFDKLGMLAVVKDSEIRHKDPKMCIKLTFDKVIENIGEVK